MSRKDTIIIAVLINAGLLIVLFACALKSNLPNQEYAVNSQAKSVEPVFKKDVGLSVGDEVDQALHQLTKAPIASSAQTSSFTSQPSFAFPPISPEVSQPINFADDLKTFAASERPTPSALSSTAIKKLPEVKKSTEFTEVKVKKGDVLEKIARQYQSTVDEIIAYNKLTSTNLKIGQPLKIPHKKTDSTSSSPSSIVAPHSADAKYYTVKHGDNPWTIAVKNHIKVEELLKLNNLDQEKARKLKPGDKLLIQ